MSNDRLLVKRLSVAIGQPSVINRSRNSSCSEHRIIMRIVVLVFLVLVNESLAGGGGGKHHVHFKIHVPDIINHHIHTKTIFIHVHHGGHGGGKKMVPKKKHVPKKETHHEEGHHEDWNSWSSYDFHSGHGDGHSHGHGDGHSHGHGHGHGHEHHGTKGMKPSGKGHMHGKMPKPHGHAGHYTLGGYTDGYGHGYDPRSHPYGNDQSQMLAYDPGQTSQYNAGYDHPVPPQQGPSGPSGYGSPGPGGAAGYSYPPQYGVHENVEEIKHVKETPNEIFEPYNEVFEEGYRKGLHSHTGHIHSEDMKNFYDNNFEEGDSDHNGYDSQSFENYKNLNNGLQSNDAATADLDGYNYHDGDSYQSSVTDSR